MKKRKERKDPIEREGDTIEGTMKIVDRRENDRHEVFFLFDVSTLFTYIHLSISQITQKVNLEEEFLSRGMVSTIYQYL